MKKEPHYIAFSSALILLLTHFLDISKTGGSFIHFFVNEHGMNEVGESQMLVHVKMKRVLEWQQNAW